MFKSVGILACGDDFAGVSLWEVFAEDNGENNLKGICVLGGSFIYIYFFF